MAPQAGGLARRSASTGEIRKDVALDCFRPHQQEVESAVELVNAKPFRLRQKRDIGQPVGGAGELRAGLFSSRCAAIAKSAVSCGALSPAPSARNESLLRLPMTGPHRMAQSTCSVMFGNGARPRFCRAEATKAWEPFPTKRSQRGGPARFRGGGYLDNLSEALPFFAVSSIQDDEKCRHSDLGFRVAAMVPIYDLPLDIVDRVQRGFDLTPRVVITGTPISIGKIRVRM